MSIISRCIEFKARDYQQKIFDIFDSGSFKNVMAVWPRRSGKTLTAWNLCIRECLRKKQVVYFVSPTYLMGFNQLWNEDNDDIRFLYYIPYEKVKGSCKKGMHIEFKNGSILRVCGSMDICFDVKKTPDGVVFSEFSMCDADESKKLKDEVSKRGGWVFIEGTPRGKNYFYDLYEIAVKNKDDWFVSKLTIEDTKHFPLEEVLKEIEFGFVSKDLQKQEFWTEWSDFNW